MSGRNLCASGINPHHDLCAEVAQMARGHIGFGCYGALHSNEDGDLAEAGDKNTEFFYNELYVFEPESEENELDPLVGDEGGEYPALYCVEGLTSFDRGRDESPHIFCDLEHPHKVGMCQCQTRSEVLFLRNHRSITRLQAEDRKHQQFFDGVRIR